jgi:hypothetical protein
VPIQLLCDTVQQRLQTDGVSTLVGGKDWDQALSSNVWFDGITDTVFLLPGCLEPSWLSSNAGIYAKLAPTDFTLSPSSSDPNWSYPTVNTDGAQWYKYSDNTSGAGGITSISVPVNQAIVFEIFSPVTTPAGNYLGSFGYGPLGNVSDPDGVGFAVYDDFSMDLYYAGAFVGHFAVSGQVADYGQTYGLTPYQDTQLATKFIVIPCREREILVISSCGGGFSYIVTTIPEGTTGAIITPNAPLWWGAQPGVDAQVRMALCQFEATGNAIGKQSFFFVDPGASPTYGFQKYIDGSVPGSTSVAMQVSDGLNPSSPYVNGTNGVRLNVQLTGDGTYSPEVYGSRGYTLPQLQNTSGSGVDLTSYILEGTWDVSDSNSGSSLKVKLKDPRAIGSLCPNIGCITNRPWQLWDNGVLLLEGVNERPRTHQGIRFQGDGESSPGDPTYGDQTGSNPVEYVEFVIRDAWKTAEEYIFNDIIPLDGLSVAQAYTLITDTIGITQSSAGRSPNLSSALSTTYMAQAGNPTKEFNTQIEPGDKGSEWMDRIAKTYCANYAHFMKPGAGGGWTQPQLLAEADLPSSGTALYDSVATAGGSFSGYACLFRTVDQDILEPEANAVYVVGKDYRTDRPILSYQLNTSSSQPNTAPGSRAPNWLGTVRKYSWVDPTISDYDTAEYVCGLLSDRLFPARSIGEIEAQFSSSMLQADAVTLHFLDGGGLIDPSTGDHDPTPTCRVKTLSARFIQTGQDGSSIEWSPCHYTVQVGLDASNLHTHSTHLEGISREWTTRSVSKVVDWSKPADWATFIRPLILQGGTS